MKQGRFASFRSRLVEWAGGQPELIAIALVGSYARGESRPDSDVDLVMICEAPGSYLDDVSWVGQFGTPVAQVTEYWGKVTSIRVWYQDGLEVEFGVAGWDWGSDPDDPGDRCVITDGVSVLYDPRGELQRRLAAFGVCSGSADHGG